MIQGNIRERLYNQETPPPPGAWDAIARALDNEEDRAAAPVIPMQPRSNRWLRLALAASLIGFIATTVLWLTDKNGTPTAGAGTTTAGKATDPAIVDTTNRVDTANRRTLKPDTVYITVPAPGNVPNNQLANQQTPGSRLPVRPPQILPVQPSRGNNQLANNRPNNDTAGNRLQVNVNPGRDNPVLAQAQMKDSAGNIIRAGIDNVRAADRNNIAGPGNKGDKSIMRILPRISQAGDQEYLDSLIKESPYWKMKVQQWRDKLIKSGFAPSFVNHMDMIELQKLLQEEKTP